MIKTEESLSKKISFKDEFELCYLRHQYLRKVTINPVEKDLEPFNTIVRTQARRTYFMYGNLFSSVGFELDDLLTIGRIHLVSYLGLFSLNALPSKYHKFIDQCLDENLPIPDAKDILGKDRADFTSFLKQRMEDVVRVCRQKARNIKGLLTDECIVLHGPTAPPEDLNFLKAHYRNFKYRKMDFAVFKTLKKKMKPQDGPVYEHEGRFYVCISLDHRPLNLEDFKAAGLDPHDSHHNKTPEQLLMEKEDINVFEEKKARFDSRSRQYRNYRIREFIALHKDNPRYTEEVRTARRMLKGKN